MAPVAVTPVTLVAPVAPVAVAVAAVAVAPVAVSPVAVALVAPVAIVAVAPAALCVYKQSEGNSLGNLKGIYHELCEDSLGLCRNFCRDFITNYTEVPRRILG